MQRTGKTRLPRVHGITGLALHPGHLKGSPIILGAVAVRVTKIPEIPIGFRDLGIHITASFAPQVFWLKGAKIKAPKFIGSARVWPRDSQKTVILRVFLS